MSSPPRRWMPRVPRPLQQLFDRFPLVTYEANALPTRARASNGPPTLFVFVSKEDASRDAPSYNPTCLKWQTYLRIACVPFRIVSSTNHASPTGALPFLLPADGDTLPVPVHKLHEYALAHGNAMTPAPLAAADEDDQDCRAEAYTALLDGAVRRAWLHALYLDPAHAEALSRLYVEPSSRMWPVRAAVTRQLRRAAEADVFPPSSPVDARRVYVEAAEAFAALEARLAESRTGWFFGRARPGLLDAAVFAYVRLMVVDERVGWTLERGKEEEEEEAEGKEKGKGEREGRARSMMGEMLAGLRIPELLRHHDRLWRTLWPVLAGVEAGQGAVPAEDLYDLAHVDEKDVRDVLGSLQRIDMTESLLRES